MRRLFLFLCVSVLAIAPVQAIASDSDPVLYAVTFHADWCGSCKALEPNVTKARDQADLDNKNVLFVTLDLTDATTRYQSGMLASALGLGDFYEENGGKTGFVLLVHSQTKDVLGRLTKDMSSAQITQEIQDRIAAL